jgi:RHS repeat-associated protein
MFWDESNRLRVVNDNDHQIQHYIYDGAGERILKASSQIETVYENGQVDANTTTMGLYTTYVSPYMVVDANQKYSKHYFNGTQRVASKIGEQDITMFDTNNPYLKQANSKTAENIASTDFDTLKNKQITDFSYYLSKSTNNATAKNVKVNYTEYKKVDTNTETTSAKAADNNSTFAAPQYAEIYYYHSDHLGTGTFLSDFDGNPYQFFLNLPFGETMAEQHSYSGDYTNRYKFNGKELDEETGFYYYGARYYNPKFSIWLSVDPLAEKYPGWNPYAYCYQNPINFIDPTGMEGDDWKDKNGDVIKGDALKNVKVYIFHDNDFAEQAMVQYDEAVKKYGEGAVALSNTGTTEGFAEDWGNMAGTPEIVDIMTHGKNQSINVNTETNAQFTATGNGETNISGAAAPNVQGLPKPKATLTNTILNMFSCHSADAEPKAHGEGNHAQGDLKGTGKPIAQVFSETFGFKKTFGTAGSVNFHSLRDMTLPTNDNYMKPYPENGHWLYYNAPKPLNSIPRKR